VEGGRLERLHHGGTRHAAQLSPGISRSRDGPGSSPNPSAPRGRSP
jgi:hypothetical protein